jgi:hypothetical protein
MANFRTHLAGGAVWGAAVAGYGILSGTLTPLQAGAAAALGAFGGMLPDLDSDTGKPLEFVFQVLSVLLPCLLYTRVTARYGASMEFIICYFATSYLLINFGLREVMMRWTVHRGILHSVTFCGVCAGLVYLLAFPSGRVFAMYAAAAIGLGGLVHLLLDEIHSMKFFLGVIPYPARSFGTAFKLGSHSSLATFAMLAVLGVLVFQSVKISF